MGAFLLSLLGSRWWLVGALAYPLCFIVGPDAAAWRRNLPLWLGVILLFTGLRLPLADLRRAATDGPRWRLAWLFTGMRLVVIPVVAWAITRLADGGGDDAPQPKVMPHAPIP